MAVVVNINDFRKGETGIKPLDQKTNRSEQDMFSVDAVADSWANDLVHSLMVNFADGDATIDFDDPVYGKLMEGLADITRAMTRHHLGVIDTTALSLQKYPEGDLSIGVITKDFPDAS